MVVTQQASGTASAKAAAKPVKKNKNDKRTPDKIRRRFRIRFIQSLSFFAETSRDFCIEVSRSHPDLLREAADLPFRQLSCPAPLPIAEVRRTLAYIGAGGNLEELSGIPTAGREDTQAASSSAATATERDLSPETQVILGIHP